MKKPINLPKTRLAYALSAILVVSMMPVPVSASGQNSTHSVSVTRNTIRTAGTTTGSAVIPDDGKTGTTTGGAVTTTPAPDTSPVTPGSLPGTVTGGATGADSSPSVTTTGGAVTPVSVGTKITVGKYVYKITGADTVTLKGFATDVSLSSVTVENQIEYEGVVYKVTKIGDCAFMGQTGIKKVIIRKNITDISLKAFYNCKNLTKVTIRTGVQIIRKQAFMGCSKLETVNITSTALSQVKKNAFKNIKEGAVINVVNKQARLAVKASIPSSVKINQM